MVKQHQLKFILACVLVVAASTGIGLTIWRADKANRKLVAEYEQRALPVGLARAKEECKKEGLGETDCNSMTSDVTTAECSNGRDCWIVYVYTGNKSLFASVIVERVDPAATRLRATDYVRNKVDEKN